MRIILSLSANRISSVVAENAQLPGILALER